MASGDTKTEAMLNALGNGGSADEFRGCCNTKTQQYILDAIDRVQNVEDEVEELKNNPDVVDIVDTYADLQAYDKSTLTDKDIIRVLEDSTHSNKSTYYRYSASTDSFTYVGEAGGGVNVVQTTGTSTTDVMSQNAVTSMVFADPATQEKIKIGAGTSTSEGSDGIEIGHLAAANGTNTVAVGRNAQASDYIGAMALGANSTVNGQGSIALGTSSGSNATTQGVMYINASNTMYGYNNSNYRLLTGLHDPVNDHDAATKGYVDSHGGSVTPVQITGTSTTDVMSQDATTKLIYSDIANYPSRIVINSGNASADYVVAINGNSSSVDGIAISPNGSDGHKAKIGVTGRAQDSIAIGRKASVPTGDNSIAIGYNSSANSGTNIGYNVALGSDAKAGNLSHGYTVALGAYAIATRDGEVNIGTGPTTNGYNSTSYRVLGGVHDGQAANDAVTVGQVNSVIDAINTALSTNIPHIGA